MFPLSSPEQVKIASELFDQIIPKLSPSERVEFSSSLLQKCAEYDIQEPVQAHVWAGSEVSRVRVLQAIEKRAQYMNPEQLLLLRQATDDILELPAEKIAELLESLDQYFGLDSLYDRGIPDPQAIHDAAAEPQRLVKIAEYEIPQQVWESACDAGLLDVFDDNVRHTLKKSPEMLSEFSGTAVEEHIVNGLESLGLIER